jgi:branched-subunit amino acid ABC-type transport system permease component
LLAVDYGAIGQLTANGIIAGSGYGLLGVGFALILGVTGRFHFAYSITYTLSAYMAFTMWDRVGLPFWPATVIGLLLVTVLGVGMERIVYQPLAERAGATALLAIFVAALGLTIAGGNLVQLFWGSAGQNFYGPNKSAIHLGDNIAFTNIDLYQVITGAVAVGALTALLRFTGLGRAIKATRVNPELATIIGINAKHIYMICFAIGTFLGGLAAFWQGLRFTVDPFMGDRPIIFAFVVAFLAGTASSPLRVFLTGIAVSLLEQWSSLFLSTRWTQTAVFVILMAYLVGKAYNLRTWLQRLVPPGARAGTGAGARA